MSRLCPSPSFPQLRHSRLYVCLVTCSSSHVSVCVSRLSPSLAPCSVSHSLSSLDLPLWSLKCLLIMTLMHLPPRWCSWHVYCKVIVLDQIMNSEMTHFVFCGLSSLFCAAELLIVFLLFKNKPYCWFTPKVSAISLIGLFFQSKDGTCVSIMRHYKNAHLSVNWPTNFEHLSWMSVLLSFSLPIYNYCI